jgi:hypothetical protein
MRSPGFRRFGALDRQIVSPSRANGRWRNCVPNKDRADFSPVLESDHTIAVAQGSPPRDVFKRNQSSGFRQIVLRNLPHSGRTITTMRTMCVIFVFALILISFEIYSDAFLTGAECSQVSAPDPASAAIAHGLKHG